MKKHNRYYAEHCPYGVSTISDGDTLMIFETREERDEMVERLNNADKYGREVARAILRKDAASLYRLQDINTEREIGWTSPILLKTCAGRCVSEVGRR